VAVENQQKHSKRLSLNAFMHSSVGYVAKANPAPEPYVDPSFDPTNKLNQDTISSINYQSGRGAAPASMMANQVLKLAKAAKEMMTNGRSAEYGSPNELYSAIGDFMLNRPAITNDASLEGIKSLLQSTMAKIQPAVSASVQIQYEHQMPTSANVQGTAPTPYTSPYSAG